MQTFHKSIFTKGVVKMDFLLQELGIHLHHHQDLSRLTSKTLKKYDYEAPICFGGQVRLVTTNSHRNLLGCLLRTCKASSRVLWLISLAKLAHLLNCVHVVILFHYHEISILMRMSNNKMHLYKKITPKYNPLQSDKKCIDA